jgi:hypothetical protein
MAFAALPNTNMWLNCRGTINCCAPSRGKYALQSNTRLSYGHPNRITGVTILNLTLKVRLTPFPSKTCFFEEHTTRFQPSNTCTHLSEHRFVK